MLDTIKIPVFSELELLSSLSPEPSIRKNWYLGTGTALEVQVKSTEVFTNGLVVFEDSCVPLGLSAMQKTREPIEKCYIKKIFPLTFTALTDRDFRPKFVFLGSAG